MGALVNFSFAATWEASLQDAVNCDSRRAHEKNLLIRRHPKILFVSFEHLARELFKPLFTVTGTQLSSAALSVLDCNSESVIAVAAINRSPRSKVAILHFCY